MARAAERAARESFGRLVAYLAARSRDVAGAEDALADALVLALERWPKGGVPDNPDAWLLTVARRRLIDRSRRTGLDPGVSERLQLAQDEAEAVLSNPSGFPDERLALLFVCAHPSIDSASAPYAANSEDSIFSTEFSSNAMSPSKTAPRIGISNLVVIRAFRPCTNAW